MTLPSTIEQIIYEYRNSICVHENNQLIKNLYIHRLLMSNGAISSKFKNKQFSCKNTMALGTNLNPRVTIAGINWGFYCRTCFSVQLPKNSGLWKCKCGRSKVELTYIPLTYRQKRQIIQIYDGLSVIVLTGISWMYGLLVAKMTKSLDGPFKKLVQYVTVFGGSWVIAHAAWHVRERFLNYLY